MKSNPIDNAFDGQVKAAAEKRAEDLKLWEAWKQNPGPETTRPIMQRFEPVFKAKIRQWKAPNVNEDAFRTELQLRTLKALETFDPSKAGFRTHLEFHLQKAMRFNANQQNYARIPEGQARRIGKIDSARNELSEELGRDPTHEEIAELLNSRLVGKEKALSGKQVAKIQASRINDVVLSSLEQDPSPNAINRDREIISLLRPTLKPDEQVVFDHLYGINGRPLISSTNELARTLGKQPSQISRLRSSILKRVQNA